MTIENIEPADSPLPFMVKVTEARTTLHEYAAMCLKELGENAPQDRCPFCHPWVVEVDGLASVQGTRVVQDEYGSWFIRGKALTGPIRFCPDCGMPLDVEAK